MSTWHKGWWSFSVKVTRMAWRSQGVPLTGRRRTLWPTIQAETSEWMHSRTPSIPYVQELRADMCIRMVLCSSRMSARYSKYSTTYLLRRWVKGIETPFLTRAWKNFPLGILQISCRLSLTSADGTPSCLRNSCRLQCISETCQVVNQRVQRPGWRSLRVFARRSGHPGSTGRSTNRLKTNANQPLLGHHGRMAIMALSSLLPLWRARWSRGIWMYMYSQGTFRLEGHRPLSTVRLPSACREKSQPTANRSGIAPVPMTKVSSAQNLSRSYRKVYEVWKSNW